MGWLFGALAEGGVELPDTFDLKGIIKLLASIFGLTWTNIRNRLVKQIGEKAMAAVEKGVGIFQTIATQGIAGLWQMLLEKLGNIKEMILEQVKDFVVTKIITAGITWLIGLLNPAAAFIKACKLIYDVVMFFVNNAARIMKFVNTVIDSVADIVRGNVSGVVNKINDVLGQMVPIIIGFLASVIGLGGIGQKIRQIIETLQKPVNKALDFVIKTGLKLAGPIIRGIKGISGKVKAKVAAGKAWVKGKAEAGKEWAKGKVARQGQGAGGDPAKVKRLAEQELATRLGRSVSGPGPVRSAVGAVYAKYRPKGLSAIRITSTDVGKFGFAVTVSRTIHDFEPQQQFVKKDFKVGIGKSGRATGVKHTALVAQWNGASLPRQGEEGDCARRSPPRRGRVDRIHQGQPHHTAQTEDGRTRSSSGDVDEEPVSQVWGQTTEVREDRENSSRAGHRRALPWQGADARVEGGEPPGAHQTGQGGRRTAGTHLGGGARRVWLPAH